MAKTVKIQDIQNNVQAILFSRVGSCHADANVGIEPINMTLRLIIIQKIGFLRKIQSKIPTPAPTKQNLSSKFQFHPDVPHLKANITTNQAQITAERICPLIAPADIIPISTIKSSVPQIIQLAFAGFVSPRKIALMYGTNPKANNNPAKTEKIFLIFNIILLKQILNELHFALILIKLYHIKRICQELIKTEFFAETVFKIISLKFRIYS